MNKEIICQIITNNGLSFDTTFVYIDYIKYDNRRHIEINTEETTTFTIDTNSIISITYDNTEDTYTITTDSYKMYITIL